MKRKTPEMNVSQRVDFFFKKSHKKSPNIRGEIFILEKLKKRFFQLSARVRPPCLRGGF